MASYKLSFTAEEIDEKLGKIDTLEDQIDEIETNMKQYIEEILLNGEW